ncbi:MAG: NAD(P)-dependent oxidoreductase [Planctomycetota bacterium]
MPDKLRIGWIGTGLMGQSMVRRLLGAGYPVAVTTRTPARAEPLLALGATWSHDPFTLAEQSDLVCSMVGYPCDVEAVHLGPRGTLSAGASRPRWIIDFTTSSPELAQRLAAHAAATGGAALDAPVSGGDIGARNGTLSIMVGGDPVAFERAAPVFAHLGQKVVHHGAAGSGQHTKMVNQILIATNMIGVCEGLLYARRAGLDPERVIESVGGGAAGSWSILQLGPRIVRGDFAPGFLVEHFIKDMAIALAEAERMHLALPGLALARQLYEAVRAQGHARSGTQALYRALEHLSGGETPGR